MQVIHIHYLPSKFDTEINNNTSSFEESDLFIPRKRSNDIIVIPSNQIGSIFFQIFWKWSSNPKTSDKGTIYEHQLRKHLPFCHKTSCFPHYHRIKYMLYNILIITFTDIYRRKNIIIIQVRVEDFNFLFPIYIIPQQCIWNNTFNINFRDNTCLILQYKKFPIN